jgi:hypothetical protein
MQARIDLKEAIYLNSELAVADQGTQNSVGWEQTTSRKERERQQRAKAV